MPKAFDQHDDAIPTVRWIGEVDSINDEYFSGVIRDVYVGGDVKAVVEIPFSNILGSEKPRAIPGMLFYCDVELAGDAVKNIRGIEFDDELTATLHSKAAALLLGVIVKDEERWGV